MAGNGRSPIALWLAASGPMPSFLTLSRASSAAYIDVNGVLQTASSNVARVPDYQYGAVAGLTSEAANTNLLLNSNLFTAFWSTSGASITATAGVSPDGTTNAFKIGSSATTAQSVVVSQAIATTIGQTYTYTVYFKQSDARYAYLAFFDAASGDLGVSFDLQAGTVGSTFTVGSGVLSATPKLTPIGNGWYRAEISKVAVSAATVPFLGPANNASTTAARPQYTAGTIGFGILAYQADCILSANARSPISTTGATVTRAADTFTLGSYTTNPAIIEAYDIATASVSRTAYPTGIGATLPQNISARKIAIYRPGTTSAYLNTRLTVGGPF